MNTVNQPNEDNITQSEGSSNPEKENLSQENAHQSRTGQLGMNIDGSSITGYIVEDEKEYKKRKAAIRSESESSILDNHLQTILSKLDQLQADVDFVKKRTAQYSENRNNELLRVMIDKLPNITSNAKEQNKIPPEADQSSESIDLIKEFVTIYHSQTVKRSLSLNEELEKQVKLLIAKHYGITENDSRIMNTALMIALLKISS